ncbi:MULTISPECIES: GNAT family N-acetyltransferase [Cyanophyceae]|uniref:GNAT family N-acetyltransferase n=1 Tax=Cyanophyceae TaxID=3028117 RepID=UPI00232CAF46|nr:MULTISPECIES: GNAT family N-acetyltransferase [Cyanophyceae]MDB9356678.1 GNAT family N-acetyltransferase [Nodularia spumigena CS-587/03]MDB9322929.1 GNAT family N-acetyltransferase [Nodularia spumigena CS-591/07A]MDB9329435.1 GNAT family N-acetyltransferase [Nodularia spumigena CS-591/04]MDB9336884.1 GNAT family N-acetyltransferase [Nodularia spumigena CS-590/01]MDB9338043.1 GNAT family N-acetyltransferase [Nodularia spumigena CS-589/07]
MENQIVLYIYSFPSYLREKPRVKIGRTSGSIDTDPTELALHRIRTQVKTSHPEVPKLLGAVKVPGEWVETTIHSQLKSKGYHIPEAPGIEWFEFPNQKELQDFLDKLYGAVIIDDFSELGGGRRDVEGDSFESIISAFGVKKLSGSEFRREIELIKVLNNELSPLYPGFPQWLERTMNNSDTVFNVAYRDKQAIGVAIWKPKANGIAKLSTLFVTEDYRRSGIGRNLILICFEQWKSERIRRAFVTTAKVELVPFFERYGFWVEGIGREIYEREAHQPEWFLTKLFFYESDQNNVDAISKAKILFPSIISTFHNPTGRKDVEQIRLENARVQLSDSNGSLIHQFSIHSWLNLTYPAESVYTPQTAYIIPILPQFLIQIFQAGKTVYYGKCSRTQDDMRGALILFYASRPISGIVAIARIVNRYIGTPNKLYNDLGMKGVLTLEEIGSQEQQRHAIEFDFLMPLRQVVHLNDLRSSGVLNGPPQTMHSLNLERYRKAVELGGVYAG